MTAHPEHPDSNLPPAFTAALATYSAREQARQFPVPSGFAERVTTRALARFHWMRRLKWATALTATAAILTLGYFGLRPANVPPPPVHPPVAPLASPTTPSLSESLAEVREALASLSRSTADKAVGPTKAIPTSAEVFRLPTSPAVAPTVEPVAQSLAAMKSGAQSSLEPLAASTRRAVSLFFRDTGLQNTN